jgi:hypothetical protein
MKFVERNKNSKFCRLSDFNVSPIGDSTHVKPIINRIPNARLRQTFFVGCILRRLYTPIPPPPPPRQCLKILIKSQFRIEMVCESV